MQNVNTHMGEELHVLDYEKTEDNEYTITTEQYGDLCVNWTRVVKKLDAMKADKVTEFWAVFDKVQDGQYMVGSMRVTGSWPQSLKPTSDSSCASKSIRDIIGCSVEKNHHPSIETISSELASATLMGAIGVTTFGYLMGLAVYSETGGSDEG